MENNQQKRLFSVISGIMDAVQSALIITDQDCNFLLKNPQSESFIKSIGKDNLKSDMVKLKESLGANSRTCQSLKYEVAQKTIELECTVSTIPEQDFLVWSIQDFTQQKEAEREAKEQEKKADHSEKMASIGEMSASIVHEIRNPLTIITGQVSLAQEYLNRGKMTDEFSQRLIDRLEKSATRINGIIKSLLNLSRNTGNDQMQGFSLNEILDEVNLFASLKIKGAKVPLTIEKPEKDVKIVCHPSEITQVLINLVKNAKEEIHSQEKPWVKIEIQESSESILIMVTDSGNGIPEEVASKIFDPYFTTKAIGEGTGIGLSLCKKLIEEGHKGKFYLDKNCPNTRFIVEVPKPKSLSKSA